MLCPSCSGAKTTMAFVEYRDKTGDFRHVACSTCKGTGDVDEGYIQRREQGKRLRQKRVKGGEYRTWTYMAELCGVDVVTLSKMEHGELPIPESVWQAYGLEEEESCNQKP